MLLQLKAAAQSLVDDHNHQQQQQQQQDDGGQVMQQQLLGRSHALYLQLVHELAVLPNAEGQQVAAGDLVPCMPVMLRLPRLMARVVQAEAQQHQEHGVSQCAACCPAPCYTIVSHTVR